MSNPKGNKAFGVVVPVKDRAAVVGRTLDSIGAQTWRPMHLYLVDNGSTDGTLQVLQEWKQAHEAPDFQVDILTESRPGGSAARQRGLEAVQEEYLCFFDSDDLMKPGMVATVMEAFAGEGRPELVLFDSEVRREDSTVSRRPQRSGDPLWQHFHHSTLYTLGYAATTDLYRRAGGWNPDLRIWDDWELGLRLLLQHPRMKRIPQVLNAIVISEESITGQTYFSRADRYDAPLIAAERALSAAGQTRLASLTHYKRAMLAALFAREGREDLATPLLARALTAVTGHRRLLLRLAYAYIRRGGRGFDRILRLLW